MKTKPFSLAALAILLVAFSAQAQDYQITTSTFGGGGSSSGGAFTVTGALETTPDNNLAGGNFSVASGFLAGVVVQQTPGAPQMSVTRDGAAVILTWSTSETGWILESSSTLNLTGIWTTASESVMQVNHNRTVTINSPSGIRFYRLRKTPQN